VGQDAALQELAQIPLYVPENRFVIRAHLPLPGQPALQMVLYRLIGGGTLRLAALVYAVFSG